MIDGHGDDLYRYPGQKPVNFSSNIVSDADHSGLMAHLAGMVGLASVYPDPSARVLARRLGRESSVEVTAGATEAIYLIAMAWRGAGSVILGPTFREYEDACRLHGHVIRHARTLEETDGGEVIWICNPNNPTGQVLSKTDLMASIRRHPHSIYVIDQAYAPYTTRHVMSNTDAIRAGNVILLNSLTKRFSVPGLRVGYAVGAARLIRKIRAMRMPWSVNSLAIEGGLWLLDHKDEYKIDARRLNAMARAMAGEFREAGIETTDTECNFVLCRLPDGLVAADLKDWLMENENMLIRDASNFTGLTPSHFRVAVQDAESNTRLINAVRKWLTLSRS